MSDCSNASRGYEPYSSGHGLPGKDADGVAGMLLLTAENGEEQRFQSSMPSVPMNDGDRGEETSWLKLSGMLNGILLPSRGLTGSDRGPHVNDMGEL